MAQERKRLTTRSPASRQAEHDQIAREIEQYLQSGGKIKTVPDGCCISTGGIYNSTVNNATARAATLTAAEALMLITH